jgi:predicted PurR-regulated permease PerM
MTDEQAPQPRGRWRRLVRSVPRRSAGGGATAAGGAPRDARRPRRGLSTGLPTLDDMLNPRGAVAEDPQPRTEPGRDPEAATTATPAVPPEGPPAGATAAASDQTQFGAPGRPINRAHPFYVGFVGALGVLLAYGLVSQLGRLSGVITLLIVSLFLALGLDPVVRWLENRGLPRPAAITVVFLGVVGVFAGFISAVIPPVVSQATELASQLPQYVQQAQTTIDRSPSLSRINSEYQVTERIQQELEKRLSSGETVTALFGGIFGVGLAIVSGIFSALTVLVLTLYFLASLRSMKAAAYRLVPRSRRRRVQMLGDEVTKRVGGYVIGQLALASINGVASYLVLSIVGIPYAAVLAFTVGLLGIIPLVGATLGAIIVVIVALFTSLSDAVVLLIYYVLYQQFENYVLGPRIMARTVSVPGAVALVAALAGGSLLGILGALIAIPIAAGVLLIVQEVLMPQQDRA